MTIRRKHISFKNNERDNNLFKFLDHMSEIYGFSSYINPDVMICFVDKMSVVIIIAMLILKHLGFENLEKWIWLNILLKVVVMCL